MALIRVSMYCRDDVITVYAEVYSLQLLVALLAVSLACASPHLLITKSLLNEHVVEGKDLTVQYSLYNIGTRLVPIQSVCM